MKSIFTKVLYLVLCVFVCTVVWSTVLFCDSTVKPCIPYAPCTVRQYTGTSLLYMLAAPVVPMVLVTTTKQQARTHSFLYLFHQAFVFIAHLFCSSSNSITECLCNDCEIILPSDKRSLLSTANRLRRLVT